VSSEAVANHGSQICGRQRPITDCSELSRPVLDEMERCQWPRRAPRRSWRSPRVALKDKKEALTTGQEKDVTNLDKLLIDAVEEAKDHKRLEDEAQGEQDGKEQRLLQRGEIIRRMAMERRAHRSADSPADASAPSRDPTSGRGNTTAPPGSPGSSKSTPTRRGRRRKRCEIEEDDVVDLVENSEKRRWDLNSKEIELGDRRLNQERQLHDEEMARRDRFEKEMRERTDRRDEEQREERAALLQVVSSLVRKMGYAALCLFYVSGNSIVTAVLTPPLASRATPCPQQMQYSSHPPTPQEELRRRAGLHRPHCCRQPRRRPPFPRHLRAPRRYRQVLWGGHEL